MLKNVIFFPNNFQCCAVKKADKSVTVQFQKNACCDEGIMVAWIQNDWSSSFSNPPVPGSDNKLLIADIHWGQQTRKVKKLFNIPGGLTG